MNSFLIEVLVSDTKYRLMKELNECKHIAFSALVDKYGRDLLDNMIAKNLVMRIFCKRGTIINSFIMLSEEGRNILTTALIVKGDNNDRTTDLQDVRRIGKVD